jgi:RecA/RadA recombinase|tara:strand:+ start:1537 stop:2595 length:1059 start_codon:yes stop_codon:yes gene_type:complete
MSDLLKSMVKVSGNTYANVVNEGIESDINGFVDTGSYTFNALLSGSIYGGIPDNKILAIAGESATGKTFFTISIVQKFLIDNPDAVVLYFDSEQAVTSEMLTSRGVDAERIAVFPVATVEDFRHQCIQIVDNYRELPREDQKPMLIVLDSLGMLSTTKEMKDTAEGKDVRDMTRAQVVKSTFRTLTLKLGEAGIPLIMTNHTYKVVGAYVPMSEMGGGTGLKYAASTIVYLTKKKVKEGTDVVGNIIHCKLYKGRLTKENSVVDVLLNYESGVNPYYGLLDIALKHGIVKKSTTRYEFPDGSKAFEKAIYKDPDKYFTEDIMKQIDEACKKEFLYGTSVDDDTTTTLELESE